MAQPKLTTSKGLETAERVRRAALKLFARFGYAAVSMRQIATEVGVQPGALYNHFPTKQDILKDLMLAHMAELLSAWADERATLEPNADLLDAFVRFHIRYHLDRADEVFVSYMELRNLEPQNFAELEETRRTYETVLTDILSDGANRGFYGIDDAQVTTRALIAMLTGLPTWYRDGGRLTRDDIERLYVTMARKMVAPTTPNTPTGDRMT